MSTDADTSGGESGARAAAGTVRGHGTDTAGDGDRGAWTPATSPTRTSSLLASVVALVVVGALLWQVPLVVAPALVGCAGAASLAASLWFVATDRFETVGTVAASVLTVPVAAGLLVGVLGTVLLLTGAYFPVQRTSQLPIRSLVLLARVGIVTGCLLAVLGVALGLRTVAGRESLADHYWLTVRTAAVPAAVGGVMAAGAILSRNGSGDVVGSTLAGLVGAFLAPGPVGTHVASLLALVALAALGARGAVGALPVAELLADSGAGETEERRVARARSVLGWLAGLAGVGCLLVLPVELSLRPVEVRQVTGPTLYRLLAALSTVGSLRVLLFGVVVLTVPAVLVAAGLRRAARSSAGGLARRVGPFVGGALVTAAAAALARPVLGTLLAWVADKLPGPLERSFSGVAASVVRFYGPPAVAVGLVTVLVAVTAAAILCLRLALLAGYLDEETAGYSLAAGGLFAAAALAGTIGAARPLVFGGLVAGLFVWDMGQYGTRLGREIGRHAPSRNAELVHAGGTLAVGAVGVAVALGVAALLDAGAVASSPGSIAALVGALAGIVLLVAALR